MLKPAWKMLRAYPRETGMALLVLIAVNLLLFLLVPSGLSGADYLLLAVVQMIQFAGLKIIVPPFWRQARGHTGYERGFWYYFGVGLVLQAIALSIAWPLMKGA